MTTAQQLWLAATVVIFGYVVGFYFRHRQVEKIATNSGRHSDDLRSGMNP